MESKQLWLIYNREESTNIFNLMNFLKTGGIGKLGTEIEYLIDGCKFV